MAALGSNWAAQLAMASRKDNPETYQGVLAAMRKEWDKFLSTTEAGSLYTGILKFLAGMMEPLAQQFTGAAPEFVISSAWQDKTIFTALASFTALSAQAPELT